MKINPLSNTNYISKYNAGKVKIPDKAMSSFTQDEVSFSEDAISFSKVFAELSNKVELRSPAESARISEVADLVRKGEYRVDSDKIAESMLVDFLSE